MNPGRIRKNISAARSHPHFVLKKVDLGNIKRAVDPDPYTSIIPHTMEVGEYFISLINELNLGKGNDSPFFCDLSNPIELGPLSEVKKQEVISIYQGQGIEKIRDDNFDILTVIPFRGRKMHLLKTLETLIDSANSVDAKIGFLVVENSHISIAYDVPDVFNSVNYRWLNSGGKMFNKCLCHNIGAYITNSNIIHFHDCDIMVPVDFYSHIIQKMEKNQAVQCFSSRRVNYVEENATKDILSGANSNDVLNAPYSFKTGSTGAPGGSIALKRNLFDMVGGFDPHFFWGYSVEDAFFWKKVSFISPIVSLNNPDVELFHLWHPPSWGKNPLEHFEKNISKKIDNPTEMQKYLPLAVNLYHEILSQIVVN